MLRLTPLLALLATLAVSGCGGSKKPPQGSASVGGSAKNNPGASAYRYSDCMRQHGVSAFEDPKVTTNGNQVSVTMHIDQAISSSPNFNPAQKACAHLLPNDGQGSNGRARRSRKLASKTCWPSPTACAGTDSAASPIPTAGAT